MRALSLTATALLTSCAGIAVVDSGHAAVVMTAQGELSVLGEGVSDVPPDAVVDDFDLRQQDQGGTFHAVTSDGVPVVVGNPIVSYRWVPEELVQADRTVGRERAGELVSTLVGAATTRVLATYRWDALDSAHVREVETKVFELARAQLQARHLVLIAVELKGLYPRLPELAKAVTETSAWEQRSATAQTGVELARQRADRLRSDAAGLAAANGKLASTLTPAVQQNKADQAWRALVTAPTTTVEVSSSPKSNLEVTP